MKIYHVDAFAGAPFAGNPAAVCVLEHPKVAAWMQHVAGEINLSETAFLIRQGDGYNLRWFSPGAEVDLCGHATLASAFVLFDTKAAKSDLPIRFYTKSGLLQAKLADEEWIELDFPATPETEAEAPEGLLDGLGIEKALYVGKNIFDYLVEIESEAALRELKPNFSLLGRVPARGVIVTCKSGKDEFDFLSRCFFPALGINEDPVTGSAHCCLGPYWGKRLGKEELVGCQASQRGGLVRVRQEGERVYLKGQAVIVMRGELVV